MGTPVSFFLCYVDCDWHFLDMFRLVLDGSVFGERLQFWIVWSPSPGGPGEGERSHALSLYTLSHPDTVHQLVAHIFVNFVEECGSVSSQLVVGYANGLLHFTAVPSVRSLRWVPPLLLLPSAGISPLGCRLARCAVDHLIKVIAFLV